MRILVLHGPNLNLLGKREPDIYGSRTLEEVVEHLKLVAEELGVEVASFQSNSEGALIDTIQAAMEEYAWIIINPGGFTHTSVSLRDALLAVRIPVLEVHLSNPLRREKFRHHSYISDIAVGTVAGLGYRGYEYALRYAAQHPNTAV